MRIEWLAALAVTAAACGDDASATDAPPADAAIDGAPTIVEPSLGERCGNGLDDDDDGLADEDCTPSLFTGAFAPAVASDPAIAAVEAATGRRLAVLQTYHAMTPLGVERTGPDLAAIFAHGAVAHLNVEPAGYTPAQLASPTSAPVATDLAAMASAIASALVGEPFGRVLLTFGAEMNGAWTDWGCLPPAQYIQLYRAAHAAITAELDRASIPRRRVRWVFGPDARGTGSCASAVDYYPGHAYVDLVGLSAYRAGTESVEAAVIAPMTALLSVIPPALQRDRFVVLQTGTREPDRDAWLASLYATLAADERVAGAIYFSASADWAIPVDGAGWAAWIAALAAAPVADGRLEGIFTPHFWDVPFEDAAFHEIQALYDAGATSGCGTDPPRFCPTGALDRRAAAVLIARAFRIPPRAGPPRYRDVAADDPAFAEIQALADFDPPPAPGCDADEFCGDALLTEAELAAILAVVTSHPLVPVTGAMATRARAAVLVVHAAQLLPHPLEPVPI